jgi:hypothetical protein
MRLQLFDTRLIARLKRERLFASSLSPGSATPFPWTKMASAKMRSCIVVHLVLLALLTLLAGVQRLLGLEGRFSRLYADPHAPRQCVDSIPVTLELVRAPKSVRAFCAEYMR